MESYEYAEIIEVIGSDFFGLGSRIYSMDNIHNLLFDLIK